MKSSDFEPGDRVRYVPGVAHGDSGHPACEDGIVSSANETVVFVRYGRQTSGTATDPEDLRRWP